MAGENDELDDDLLDDLEMVDHEDEENDLNDDEEDVDALEDEDGEDEDAEDEDDSEDDDDNDAGEDDDDDVLEGAPRKKGKNKKTARDRISELTRRLREAERATFEAELKAREKPSPSEEAETPLVEPDPKNFDYGEFDEKYLDALADYRAETKIRERMKESESTTQAEREAERNEHYRKRLAAVMEQGAAKYDDFEEIVNSTPFEPDLARLVLDSSIAVDIARYLGNNLKALRTITAMSPSDRSRAIGRLEGRFSASSAVRKTKRSKAPEAPGGKRKKPTSQRRTEAKYGPADQDAFDKAFFQY